MRHSAPLNVAISFMLIALASCDQPKPSGQGMPSHSIRFLALGDSYTSGESVSPDDRWPVQLAGKLRQKGIDVTDPEIVAVTGWTTDELSDGIDQAAPRGPFGIVTLLIGVNNQYRGRSVEEFRMQFNALLLRAIRLAGGDQLHFLVLSIPDWGVTPFAEGQDRAKISRQIDAFNQVCREESARAGAAFVDITPQSKSAATDRTLIAGDGLHPSGKMYEQWAALALPRVEAMLTSHGFEERPNHQPKQSETQRN